MPGGCRGPWRDMAMSSRAIPGRVVPGSSRQEPAALTPNKQPGSHRHIPGQPVATAGAEALPVYPRPAAGRRRRGAPGAGLGGAPPVCMAGGGSTWGPPQPAWLRDSPGAAPCPSQAPFAGLGAPPKSSPTPCPSTPPQPPRGVRGVLLGTPPWDNLPPLAQPCSAWLGASPTVQ